MKNFKNTPIAVLIIILVVSVISVSIMGMTTNNDYLITGETAVNSCCVAEVNTEVNSYVGIEPHSRCLGTCGGILDWIFNCSCKGMRPDIQCNAFRCPWRR